MSTSTHTTPRAALRVIAATAVVTAALLAAAPAALAAGLPQGFTAEENPGGTYVRTEQVAGGGTAKIYRVSATHHRAEFINVHGGVLDADGRTTAGSDNGSYRVLTPEGHFASWLAYPRNEFHGPGTLTLARDYQAVVEKVAEDKWLAKISRPAGGALLTLETHAVPKPDGGLSDVYAGMEIVDPAGRTLFVILDASGIITSYAPAGAPGGEQPQDKCTATAEEGIGAAVTAHLSNSPDGPEAYFTTPDASGDPERVFGTLDKDHPKLRADAGIEAEITGAGTSSPKLRTRTQGGVPAKVTRFPAVPAGCALKDEGAGSGDEEQAQTSEIPEGGVEAGANVPAGADEGSGVLIAVGGAAAAAGAAGICFVALRRRNAVRG